MDMKGILIALLLSASFPVWSCPQLQGAYNHCHSEIRQMKGEYIVDQHQENDYEVYNVQYIDDESGASREDVFRTNGVTVSQKETLPRIGVRVRIEAAAHCEGDVVKSEAKVYFLGAHVGNFVTKIYGDGKFIKSDADGSYLGREIHKRIVCELK